MIDLKTGKYTTGVQYNTNSDFRANDGKCAPDSSFWSGTMGYKPFYHKNKSTLNRVDPDFSITQLPYRSTISNGIGWNKEGDKMWYADTPTNEIVGYAYNKMRRTISMPKVAVRAGETPGSFDGGTIDAEGKLWWALWDGEGVGRYDPSTGRLLEFIRTPGAKQASSCAFTGENLNILRITMSADGLTEQQKVKQPMSGVVFKIEFNHVRGIPASKFG